MNQSKFAGARQNGQMALVRLRKILVKCMYCRLSAFYPSIYRCRVTDCSAMFSLIPDTLFSGKYGKALNMVPNTLSLPKIALSPNGDPWLSGMVEEWARKFDFPARCQYRGGRAADLT